MNLKKELGVKIKRLRQKRGLTQEKLAEKLNISTYTLIGIETGKNFMTAQTLEKIIETLDAPLDDFFTTEHLKSTGELLEDINSIINNFKDDRDKIEEIYKILKAISYT